MPKRSPKPADGKRDQALKHSRKMAELSRQNYAAKAEIGELRKVKNPKRRKRCEKDLHEFLKSYFPGTTGKSPFSASHRRLITRLQLAIMIGGRFWNVVFRGFAKTTICVNTCLWALLYGHRKLVVLVGANRAAADDLLEALKSELETNPLLAEDFPEVCQAIEALNGKAQGCASQTFEGTLTRIEMSKSKLVFPSLPGSVSSGACVVTRGITSSMRGIGYRRSDGVQQRPDLVIGDDLQTDASAASATQVRKRLMILMKTMMKLAGHTTSIACVINGTIIERDDLMDRLRDANQWPGWQGETVKMVDQWSDAHETLWMTDYARIRRGFDPADPDDCERAHASARAFYTQHRSEMDSGCRVCWESCFDPETEISAIQHAYNMLIDDGPDVFSAECQSEPIVSEDESEQLRLSDIVHKLSGLKHREIPVGAAKTVCHIDVQEESLWYTVASWKDSFTGYVVDYGIWPEQRVDNASKRRLRMTLSKKYPALKNPEARWRQALDDLLADVTSRVWLDSDGRRHHICLAAVDVADGDAALPIRSWSKTSRFSAILKPAMGLALKPSDTPLGERKKDPDEIRRGLNWVEKRDKKVRGGSILWVDVNYWKSFLRNRWRAGSARPQNDPGYRPDEPGAVYLWGTDPNQHATFGAHQCSEFSTSLTHDKSGRSMDFWTLRPNKPDNEFFDNMAQCCALGDVAGGVSLKDSGLKSAPRPRRTGPRKAVYLS